MYQYLQGQKNIARALDVLLVSQIAIYGLLTIARYHVRNLDPAIETSWVGTLGALCIAFLLLGGLNVLLLALGVSQSSEKRSILRTHRVVLLIGVASLIMAGRLVVSWINVRADLGGGPWPFVQL